MSVADEAKAAAEAEYPAVTVGDPIARVQRVPFAHGYQRGIQAALDDLPGLISRVMCAVCGDDGEFIQSPGGSWWAHDSHPDDHHDYVPTVRA
ncbi:hypothetical protein SEA_NAMAGO_63 [Microbacterium phage Namago]|nr:hypothetical protein SEA_NAMAGO_63 [Microbacterium phage Namago]